MSNFVHGHCCTAKSGTFMICNCSAAPHLRPFRASRVAQVRFESLNERGKRRLRSGVHLNSYVLFMHLQGIKIRLTIIVGGLLLMSMLLVNFLLIIFWQRDAVQGEIGRDEAVLGRILDRLPAEASAIQGLSPDFFSFADFYSSAEKGHILLLTGSKKPANSPPSDSFSPLLVEIVAEAIQTGQPVLHYSGSFLGLIRFRNHTLVSALPIVRQGRVIGGVGINRSLKPMFSALWRVEKIVLVYMLFNLLILSVIGFFRMRKIFVQPIERLVQLADQYNDQEAVLFAADSPGGEFGRLATSLNSMLARIEQDRRSLEETVEELGAANLKLKTQQQEMIRTEKLASVGRMAAGLAHEIGNPLGIVQGYLGLLTRTGNQNDEYLDFINRSDQELQRVNVLIRQMLDFARVSKGTPENFSLHALLRSVIDMVQMQRVYKNIKLTCSLDADKDMVYADQDQLRQVFVNCLLNSGDAVTAAGKADDGVVTVSTDVPGSQAEDEQTEFLRIQIRDNGIGIAGDQQAVIFDPFYTTKEPGKGTGLGLSVSLSIVESLGGRIEMESTLGQGCVLSVFLPLAAPPLVSDHDNGYIH